MATKYCDLDLSGAGGDGSVGNPWTSTQFIGILNAYASADTIKIKGSATLTNFGNIGPATNCGLVLESWLSSPWYLRMDSSAFGYQNMTINGMSFAVTSPSGGSAFNSCTLLSCHFEYNVATTIAFGNVFSGAACILKGCTFNSQIAVGTSGTAFVDCIFLKAIQNNIHNPCTFDNCAFAIAQPVDGTFTNCQFNWTNPTWPVYNAVQSAFDSATLSVGINTPPEPGNPPYTGYATDPWGENRSGIGMMSFPSMPPPEAYFTSDITCGIVPFTVQFTDTSTGTPTSWFWNFGDGGATSTEQNPTHTYTEAGLYTISFTATNAGGSAGTAAIDYITANGVSYRNFPGVLDIYDYRVVITGVTLNPDSSLATVAYTGIADAAITSDLSNYEYSLDNGDTWSTMLTSSTVTGLPFVATPGYSGTLVWQIKTALGVLRYNTYIRVRIRATGASLTSEYASYSFIIERVQTDMLAAKSRTPFPYDYAGISSGDIMANAPKS